MVELDQASGSKSSHSVFHSNGMRPPSGARTWATNPRTAAHRSLRLTLSLQARLAKDAALVSQRFTTLNNHFR
jgi:hypothetical protein